jgi:hypothetical protein
VSVTGRQETDLDAELDLYGQRPQRSRQELVYPLHRIRRVRLRLDEIERPRQTLKVKVERPFVVQTRHEALQMERVSSRLAPAEPDERQVLCLELLIRPAKARSKEGGDAGVGERGDLDLLNA